MYRPPFAFELGQGGFDVLVRGYGFVLDRVFPKVDVDFESLLDLLGFSFLFSVAP